MGRTDSYSRSSRTAARSSTYVQVYEDVDQPSTEFFEAVIAAEKALAKGRIADARASFLEAEGLSPGHPDVLVGLAEASFRDGNNRRRAIVGHARSRCASG